MIQHFDGHRSPREDPFHHDVLIDSDSQLYAIVGQERLPTNTYHHQGVDQSTLASLFTPTGIVEDDPWLIEAFESANVILGSSACSGIPNGSMN